MQDTGIPIKHIFQNNLRFFQIRTVRDLDLQIQLPLILGGYIYNTCAGKGTVWNSDLFIIHCRKRGIKQIDPDYRPLLFVCVLNNIISHHKRFQQQDDHTAGQIGKSALEGQAKTLAALSQSTAGLRKQTDALAEAVAAGREQMATRKQVEALADTAEKARRQAADSARHASEAVWAQIFNNTISESLWLKDKTFSPGRWAVGYPYLYVMYRVLNETRPKRILELGLGQSTRMIAQYATAFEDVEHIVVENDKSWISFFSENLPLSQRTQVLELDLEMRSYNGIQNIRAYKDFAQTLTNHKFDFILIDGPVGGDMHNLARMDILDIVPDCLDNSFIIMIDDCNRMPENNMSLELEKCIAEADIRYKRSRVSGEKELILLVSLDMGFITSM